MSAIRLLTTMRTMDAVYWPPLADETGAVVPDERGRPAFGPPVSLNAAEGNGVFWLDSVSLAQGAGGGFQTVSGAKVFVGQDLLEGGVLFNGTLDGVPQGYADDPLGVPGAAVIQKFVKTPTFNLGEFVRVAYL